MDHLLPPARKPSSGPTVGIIIILLIMIAGAFYVWSASQNRPDPTRNLPLIPGDVAIESIQ